MHMIRSESRIIFHLHSQCCVCVYIEICVINVVCWSVGLKWNALLQCFLYQKHEKYPDMPMNTSPHEDIEDCITPQIA